MRSTKRTLRLLRILMLLVSAICIVALPPWMGIWAWLAPLPETVQAQVDDAVDHGLDGIIVYVDQTGRAPALYAAGWKNRATQEPADPHALFKIGSISKLYVAAAAAKLVANGTISLDDTLADRLPELVGRIDNAEQITLKMMLQHRSGIPNTTDQRDFDWSRPPRNTRESLELIVNKPAEFPPDTRHRYSNTNYLLIGDILDRALGYSHRRYIRNEILEPLGLTRTHAVLSDVNLESVASGYHRPYPGDLRDIEFVSPSGSMVATAQDVGLFLRALNDGSLLNDDEQAVYSSVYEYGHSGWVLGYKSIARYYQEIDTVVVQFVNTTGSETELTSNVVFSRIVRILRAPPR